MSRLSCMSQAIFAGPWGRLPKSVRTVAPGWARITKTSRATFSSSGVAAPAASSASRVLESPLGKEVTVPYSNITEFVWKDICVWEDKPFVTCTESGESFTYHEGRALAHGFARALIGKLGLAKGDVIAIVAPNIPDYVIAAHGAIEAGLIVTFVNPLYTAEETGRQLQISGCRAVATIPALLPLVNAVTKGLKSYRGTMVLGPQEAAAADGVMSVRALAEEGRSTEGVEMPKIQPDDIAILPFSSGTTGMPKGVMLSHFNIVSNLVMKMNPSLRMALYTKGPVQDKFLTALPFFHIYGFNGVLNTTICSGQHLLSLPKFTPEGYCTALKKYRPTGIAVVPAILQFLVAHPAVTAEHLESIRYVLTGAALASKPLIDQINAKAGRKLDIRQGYGMTETSPVTLFTRKDYPPEKAGSVGQLVQGTRARVVDLNTGEDLGPNQRGELYVQGPQVMAGYLNNKEATDEVIDSDKWLHTGDVVYYDEDHYFHVVDRTKELIKVKGNQVSPTELESIILQIDGIADAAVIGIPDERSGEIPRAFIVLRPGAKVAETDIVTFLNSKVAPYKKLAGGVTFIDSIPRNPGGKILRHQLKAMATK